MAQNTTDLIDEKKKKNTADLKDLYKSIMKGDMAKVIAQCAAITDLSGPVTPHRDSILHTAICVGNESIAREILKKFEVRTLKTEANALGDTVLHEAAATSMTSLAKDLLILAPDLLDKPNKLEETPLFRAAHYGCTDMFELLADIIDKKKLETKQESDKKNLETKQAELIIDKKKLEPKPEELNSKSEKVEVDHLKRKDETTILHITILAEFFDLALHIAKRYPGLVDAKDRNKMIGLQLLSSNPSAFESGSNYGFINKFIYYCAPSEDMTKKEEDSNPGDGTRESDQGSKLTPNYGVAQCFSKVVRIPIAVLRKINTSIWKLSLSQGWPMMESIYKEKRKHESALKLAKFLIPKDVSWEEQSTFIEDEDRISIGKVAAGTEEQGKDKKDKDGENTQIPDGGQPWPADLPKTPPPVEGTSSSWPASAPTSLLLATRTGIVEIVKEILSVHPQAVEHVRNHMGENILHVAIKHRQLEIFRLVKKMDIAMVRLVRQFDQRGYTILHHVGVTDYAGGTQPGPAFQLQEELRWFKRVKKITPSHYEMHRSRRFDETAQVFFERSHEKLLNEAQEWLKRTSESCSTVAVLIATVAFAAAYTVPGGPDQSTGAPVLLCDPFFVVFTVMDVLSLASSLTSVVMFLSILTSPFQLQDFRYSLPLKLTVGFIFLFFSVAVTMLAFAATIVLIIHLKRRWLIYTAVFLPVSFFGLLLFPVQVAYEKFCSTLKLPLKLIRKFIPSRFLPRRFRKTTTTSFYKTL